MRKTTHQHPGKESRSATYQRWLCLHSFLAVYRVRLMGASSMDCRYFWAFRFAVGETEF